jgi:hypothetical protein
MAVWALADLHLAISTPDKKMDFFGEPWIDYTEKIQKNWLSHITNEDLVLLPGDISWAMKPEIAKTDLDWIHALPGTKVMIRGNHDYWWSSLSQVAKVLPPSIHLIQNNAFNWKGYSIGGARLWDTPDYSFNSFIDFKENPRSKKLTESDDPNEAKKIYDRELGRLELSLKALDKNASTRIIMTHYPPISADLSPSDASRLLEKYNIQNCIFGHLHNVKKNSLPFGESKGINYQLVSCDYLDFIPKLLYN